MRLFWEVSISIIPSLFPRNKSLVITLSYKASLTYWWKNSAYTTAYESHERFKPQTIVNDGLRHFSVYLILSSFAFSSTFFYICCNIKRGYDKSGQCDFVI